MAAQKFKLHKVSKPKGAEYEDVVRKMGNTDKKKKRDPLDADKCFLLDLAKKFEGTDLKMQKKYNGKGVSGHAVEVLGYLSSREKFWEQI